VTRVAPAKELISNFQIKDKQRSFQLLAGRRMSKKRDSCLSLVLAHFCKSSNYQFVVSDLLLSQADFSCTKMSLPASKAARCAVHADLNREKQM